MNKGFSLFEVLVVSSITIFISITLIRSLSSLSRVNLESISSYVLYAGTPTINPAGLPQPCPADRNFQPIAPQNTPIYKITNLDRRVDFVATPGFNDVFFEPPGPTTYINNSSSASTEKITIKRIGTTGSQCDSGSSNCIYICVYLSGRTEITKNTTCPAI